MKNFYEILGIDKSASKSEIREVYHKLAHIYHPDKGGNEKKLKEINEAYEILSDDAKRAEYDLLLKQFNFTKSQKNSESPATSGTSIRVEEYAHPKASTQKKYPVEYKIKEAKWNAFLLKRNEVDEYLADGVQPVRGLFNMFSKAKRDDETRRLQRLTDLFRQRSCNDNKNRINNLYENIVCAILGINSKKNRLTDSDKEKLQELINIGKYESGEIIYYYPISNVSTGVSPGGLLANSCIENGLLFLTTKGICFVAIEEKQSDYLTIFTLSTLNVAGPLAALGTVFFKNSILGHKVNKKQQKIIELAYIYSPYLLVECFKQLSNIDPKKCNNQQCEFIPYRGINALIYSNAEGDGSIELIYHNGKQIFL